MKNNKFNNKIPEKFSTCSCGNRTKLKIKKNYPYGKKSKGITSKYYLCEKCREKRFVIEKPTKGRR
jgi:hypothetical protein